MNPNIVYLSTITEATDSHLSQIVLTLRNAGYTVTLLCPGGNSRMRPITHYFWHRSSTYNIIKAAIQRLKNWLTLWRLASQTPSDVYLCAEPDAWVLAVLLKKIRKVPVVEHMREIYEDKAQVVPRPFERICANVLTKIFKELSRSTDCIIHVSEQRRQLLQYLLSPTTVVHFRPDWEPTRKRRSSVRQPLKLVHAGALRPSYAAVELLKAALLCDEWGVQFELLVLNGFSGHEQIKELTDILNTRNRIKIMPAVPYSDVQRILSGADVGISLVLPIDKTHKYAQPRKLVEYMAAGLAIIAAKVPTIQQMIETHGCGLLVDATDVGEIAEAIARMAGNREWTAQLGDRALEAYRECYSWKKEIPKLLAVFDHITEKRAAGTHVTAFE